ncbi:MULTISPECIES: hypothetical protein [unclassified Bradyrhizobium]|uniref:hypothetical protein n=1 Tax=Bradyrhizobium sp. USDA 4541 TaxID=2817704 RepID=UPI0020A4892F|nr:hypothetical protein [Bradyrhizobium sp. USDA 4541]MCP1854379.1 hypothetical protein [Bradyrhizobium sp. USDA 4541]
MATGMGFALANNIISHVLTRHLSESPPAWMAAQLENPLSITALTVSEIRCGMVVKWTPIVGTACLVGRGCSVDRRKHDGRRDARSTRY